MSTIIGIDPSINSTGVCINKDGNYTYYIITSYMTKKMKAFSHPNIHFLPYDKQAPSSDSDSSTKEYTKTINIYTICNHLSNILEQYKPDKVNIEGVSYGSVGSAALVDLSGLNFTIRHICLAKGIDFQVISPTSNKKSFTGNGQADKSVMIDSWKRLDSNITNIDSSIKIDDLADAFALSVYN